MISKPNLQYSDGMEFTFWNGMGKGEGNQSSFSKQMSYEGKRDMKDTSGMMVTKSMRWMRVQEVWRVWVFRSIFDTN